MPRQSEADERFTAIWEIAKRNPTVKRMSAVGARGRIKNRMPRLIALAAIDDFCPYVPAETLADLFGCCIRNIYRDRRDIENLMSNDGAFRAQVRVVGHIARRAVAGSYNLVLSDAVRLHEKETAAP